MQTEWNRCELQSAIMLPSGHTLHVPLWLIDTIRTDKSLGCGSALISCSPQKTFSGLYIKFNALLLVRVRTSLYLRCTSCWGCEHISSSQHIIYFFCFAHIQHSFIGDISVQCGSAMSSSLQAVPWHSPLKSVTGLYMTFQHIAWWSCQLISAGCCLSQSTQVSLWTVHRHQAVSTCDTFMTVYQSDCFCLAVVNTTAFIGDICIEYAAVVSSSQTISWQTPQNWLPGL